MHSNHTIRLLLTTLCLRAETNLTVKESRHFGLNKAISINLNYSDIRPSEGSSQTRDHLYYCILTSRFLAKELQFKNKSLDRNSGEIKLKDFSVNPAS